MSFDHTLHTNYIHPVWNISKNGISICPRRPTEAVGLVKRRPKEHESRKGDNETGGQGRSHKFGERDGVGFRLSPQRPPRATASGARALISRTVCTCWEPRTARRIVRDKYTSLRPEKLKFEDDLTRTSRMSFGQWTKKNYIPLRDVFIGSHILLLQSTHFRLVTFHREIGRFGFGFICTR